MPTLGTQLSSQEYGAFTPFLGLWWLGPANLTAVTVPVSNTSYFQYLGRVNYAVTSADVVCRVTTQAATITWAEIGIFKGASVANGTATLTRLGFTDVAATFNSTGIKKTTVALTGAAAGDELWVAYGSQATTPYVLRGMVADDIQSGILQEKATTRISTVAAATAMGLSGATLVPAWMLTRIT